MPDDRGPPDGTLSDLVVSATVTDGVEPVSPSDLAGAATVVADPEHAGMIPSSAFDPMASLQVGQRLGNRYVVRAFLGQGGMGAVYRATDEKLHEDVALKVVRSALGARLREEVRLAQKVTHPNVCRTFDLEDIDGYHLVKMEYVPGETLGDLIKREGKLPTDRVLTIARALASGLAAAHTQGIVHRDLKPQNVMVSGDRILLMDFGLAQRIADDDRSKVGTPSYMAPEQIAGAAVDERTDLYALGCVVYELLTGARVFAAATPSKVMREHEQVSPPSLEATLANAPRWLTRAVMLLLSKSPAERPRGLAILLAGPPRRRTAVVIAVLATASIAAVVGGVAVATRAGAWEPAIVPLEPQFDEDGFVAISPDGTQIAYSSDREAPGVRHRVFIASVRDRDPGRAITARALDANMPRWTRDGSAVLYTASGVLFRQPVAGGPAEELGPSNGADDCGDAIVILRFAFAGSYLELRAADGSRTRLANLPHLPTYQQASVPRCSSTGDRVLFTSGASTPSACIHDVWIVERISLRRCTSTSWYIGTPRSSRSTCTTPSRSQSASTVRATPIRRATSARVTPPSCARVANSASQIASRMHAHAHAHARARDRVRRHGAPNSGAMRPCVHAPAHACVHTRAREERRGEPNPTVTLCALLSRSGDGPIHGCKAPSFTSSRRTNVRGLDRPNPRRPVSARKKVVNSTLWTMLTSPTLTRSR